MYHSTPTCLCVLATCSYCLVPMYLWSPFIWRSLPLCFKSIVFCFDTMGYFIGISCEGMKFGSEEVHKKQVIVHMPVANIPSWPHNIFCRNANVHMLFVLIWCDRIFEHHHHHHHHLFANVKHRQQQVQNYNIGRTTRQRAALTVALKYGLKHKHAFKGSWVDSRLCLAWRPKLKIGESEYCRR